MIPHHGEKNRRTANELPAAILHASKGSAECHRVPEASVQMPFQAIEEVASIILIHPLDPMLTADSDVNCPRHARNVIVFTAVLATRISLAMQFFSTCQFFATML